MNPSGAHSPTAGLSLNGAPAPLPSPATVAALVAGLAGPEQAGTGQAGTGPRGIAVAVNGEVVPRSAWESAGLRPGDRVEVLTAAQGG